MKNYTLVFIASVFSFNGFTQQNTYTASNNKIERTLPKPNNISNEGMAVVAYHVEETINMKFGGRKTTYTVSNIDFVDRNELGRYNTRVVTPKYGKIVSKKMIPVIEKLPNKQFVTRTNFINPVTVTIVVIPKRRLDYITIHILESYERVLAKGFISEEMLKAVGDYRYFLGDLAIAAKWYSQLFEICPEELDAVYFYRYARSLEYINQCEKAAAMMLTFERKKF